MRTDQATHHMLLSRLGQSQEEERRKPDSGTECGGLPTTGQGGAVRNSLLLPSTWPLTNAQLPPLWGSTDTQGSVPGSLVHLPKAEMVHRAETGKKTTTFLGRGQVLLDTGRATGWGCVSSGLWVCSGKAEGRSSSQEFKMQ